MNIIDYLNFEELIKFADTGVEIREIVTDHYMIGIHRIHEKVIRFERADQWGQQMMT